MFFLKKKIFPKKIKIFFYLFSMQLFSADAMVFSKKNYKNFDPEKVKKRASKVAHNRPRPFYFTVQPRPTAHSPQPRIDFSYYEISGPDICSLICVLAPRHIQNMSQFSFFTTFGHSLNLCLFLGRYQCSEFHSSKIFMMNLNLFSTLILETCDGAKICAPVG